MRLMAKESIIKSAASILLAAAVVIGLNACGARKATYVDTAAESAADDSALSSEDEDAATDDLFSETDLTTDDTQTTLAPSTTTTTQTTKPKPVTHVSTIGDGLGKKADSAELKLDNNKDDSNTMETVTTRAVAATTTTKAATAPSGGQTTVSTAAPAADSDTYYLSVNNILQNPELPTGCEVTSLTIVLNHLGFNVDKCYMVDHYLPWTTTWDSINTHFIGNPRSIHGCGCNAPVIVDTANRYLSDNGNKYTAVNKTGSSPSQLYELVKNGYPVMVWATIGMQDTYVSGSWTAVDTGENIVFMKREHCLVLTGYDKTGGTVTFCDPMVGVASYSMSTFETRYGQLGNQAVIITAK